jgi:hypothetical protein
MLYRRIKENSNNNYKNTAKLIESYGNLMQNLTNKIVELNNSVYECYIKGVELEASMISESSRLMEERR